MSGKVMIVGTGNVGASIAYAMLNQRTAVKELILTDIDMNDAEGEVMDLSDALAVAPSWLKIRSGTYSEAKDCDIIILTAGANQKPGESRIDLVKKNAKITKQIVEEIMANGFNGIFLVVSNPMDTLTQLVQRYSGLPFEQVIGTGTVLDSARLRYQLSQIIKVHPKSIHAYQVGEHGDSELALWSASVVGGMPISQFTSEDQRDEIENQVRKEAYQIIEKKGATHYGIGACVVQIVNCILNDERRVLAVSNYDYARDMYFGFPAIVGRKGIIRRLNPNMTEFEAIKLQRSINVLRNTLSKVE